MNALCSTQLKNGEKEDECKEEEAACTLASEDTVTPSETSPDKTITDKGSADSNVHPPKEEGVKSGLDNSTDEEPSATEGNVDQNSKMVAATSSDLEALLVESALHDVIASGSDQVDAVKGDEMEPHPLDTEPHPLDTEDGLGDLVLMHDLGLVMEKECTGLEASSREGELSETKEQQEASAEIKSELTPFISQWHVCEGSSK